MAFALISYIATWLICASWSVYCWRLLMFVQAALCMLSFEDSGTIAPLWILETYVEEYIYLSLSMCAAASKNLVLSLTWGKKRTCCTRVWVMVHLFSVRNFKCSIAWPLSSLCTVEKYTKPGISMKVFSITKNRQVTFHWTLFFTKWIFTVEQMMMTAWEFTS